MFQRATRSGKMEDLKRRMKNQMGIMRTVALSQASQNMCLLPQGDGLEKMGLGTS
jgi:hypothetical protein